MIELEVMPAVQGRAAPERDLGAAFQWRGWTEGLQESRETQKPVFCVAEDSWGNAAQRLALFLDKDAELGDVISEGFVPVLVDPDAHPDLVDRILMVARQVEDTVSPPLLAVCTEEGLPLVTSCDITFEGTDHRPSLLSLLKAARQQYTEQRKECLVEARGLQQNDPHAAQGKSLFLPAWELLRRPDAELLQELMTGGIHDQLAGGFHRASRQAAWGVPHFEKLGAHNAAMAVVLLRSDPAGYREHARDCAEFAMRSLKSNSAGLASDTPYYTWASDEILSSLPAEELQMVGLHFRISASSSRHVLNQVRSIEQSLELASGQSDEEARARLESGKQRLLSVRQARQHPEALPAPGLTSELMTIRWLLEVAQHDAELVDREFLLAHLDLVVAGAETADGGMQRPDGSLWVHDQVAGLQAMWAAGRTAGSQGGRWEQSAGRLHALLQRRFRAHDGWLVTPAGPALTVGWFDADLPAVQLELQELTAVDSRP